MNIRHATIEDMDSLLQLRFAFLEEFRNVSQKTEEKLKPALEDFFTANLGGENFAALMGFIGDKPICTAFFTVAAMPPNDQYPNGRVAYVSNVYTVPEYRKKGYARHLMEKLVQTAYEMDVTAINLNASTAGRPLYEKLDFAVLTDTAMRLQLHNDAQ